MKRSRLSRKGSKARSTRLHGSVFKPVVNEVWVERVIDESPDLSWLKTETDGKNIVSSARYSNDDVKKYGWAKVKKWIDEDHKRLDDYGRTWVMTGIVAKAKVLIPQDTVPPTFQIQTIRSGGLWGIESDSDKSYIEDVKSEQLSDLVHNLNALGMKDSGLSNMVKKAKKEDFKKDVA